MENSKTGNQLQAINEKLESIINKQKSVKSSDHREIFEGLAELVNIQRQQLDTLKKCKESVTTAPNNLRKVSNTIHSNSLYPSLPLGMEAARNLDNIIQLGAEVFQAGTFVKDSKPLSIESLEKTKDREEHLYNNMHCRVNELEKHCQNISKVIENMKNVRKLQLPFSSSDDVKSETMVSENSSIATILGEDILASSSALENELNYHCESSSEEGT